MDLKQPDEIPRYQGSGSERLERLADFIQSLLPGQITFAHWYDQDRGCAVGMAIAREPYFLAQGLKLESTESLKDCRPTYQRRSDWAAVAAFFGLSVAEARDLFDRSGYGGEMSPDPELIAAKIRRRLTLQESGALALSA